MTLPKFAIAGALSALTATAGTGCSTSNHPATGGSGNDEPTIVSVAPGDGVQNVPTTTPIAVKFNMPMDTMSVMQHGHLAGGTAMHEWMDSLSHGDGMMNHGTGMHPGSVMAHMMDWMDTIAVEGHVHWNDAMDSCEFIPNSPLAEGTDYMILIDGPIMSADGMMLDLSGEPYGLYMTHFTCAP